MSNYIMRFASEEEKKFMVNIIKKFIKEETTSIEITELSDWYNESPSKFGMNVKASGVMLGHIPLEDNHGIHYRISKKVLKEWMDKKGIIKPIFPKAELLKRKC